MGTPTDFNVSPNVAYLAPINGMLNIAWSFIMHDGTFATSVSVNIGATLNSISTNIFYWDDSFQSGDILGGSRNIRIPMNKGWYFIVTSGGNTSASGLGGVFTGLTF
jgi:hypothetical protein